MPRALDPKITAVLKEHGFGKDAVWDCRGTWVVYHRVLEQIAANAGIQFDQPFVVEANGANGIAAICVTGRLGERLVWSIGEAAPKNNKNAYPWAMAEKRAVDRVVLKLIGLHGLAYSEEEADDFKPSAPTIAAPTNGGGPSKTWHGPLKVTELREKMREFKGDLNAVSDLDSLIALLHSKKALLTQCQQDWPACWFGDGGDIKGAEQAIAERRKDLEVTENERELDHVR